MASLTRLRATTKRSIRACTRCPLSGGCTSPIPMEVGSGPALFAVVGTSPDSYDDKVGRPFVGGQGRWLREILRKAGVDVERVAWVNAVSCRPGECGGDNGRGKVTVRQPTVNELAACRDHLLAQLEASGARDVLLMGSVATSCWRDDVTLERTHGTIYRWLDKWAVMPTYGVGAVQRDELLKPLLIEDLKTWVRYINTGEIPGEEAWAKCVECGGVTDEVDQDWVPYCMRCWVDCGGQWDKVRKRWRMRQGKARKQMEKGMFDA